VTAVNGLCWCGYWLFQSLNDPIITALCGISVIPKAKMLSVFVNLGVVSIYNHLLDTNIQRHKLFTFLEVSPVVSLSSFLVCSCIQ
jgi:hypothetical protein